MRQARIRMDGQDTWHHCYNRIVGTSEDLPFGRVEKEQFVRILKRVSKLYTVRVVAYQVMSNHFHLLVHASADTPSAEEVCRRYEAFHGGKRVLYPETGACRIWQSRCRDVSWFMRHIQQLFTMWYNRTRPVRRRGSLWADRYRNTLLESGVAVWSCWKYIENNPVRAGMVKDAADYRFCSHGAWHQAGRHPFEANVQALILPLLKDRLGLGTLGEIRSQMDRTLAEKGKQDVTDTGFSLTVKRRVRHWTNGLVIGSELFVLNAMTSYRKSDSSTPHRLASTGKESEYRLHAWRRLRTAES